MKALLYAMLLFLLIIPGCKKENHILPLLQTAGQFLPTYADSASLLLDSISDPDGLDDEDFARWCMVSGKVTDETAAGLLPLYQWKRAQEWFMQHGTAEERAQVALYLGRAYVEDGEYDKAMQVYADALELAKGHQAYNVAGYICTYMADLYGFRNITSECLKKRKEAGEFFKEAGNYKSYAYALKELACEWTLIDSFSYAMPLLHKADSISQLIPNKDLAAAIANAQGISYEMQQKYDSAEIYYLKAIATGSAESYKDSVALSQAYIKDNQLAKAYEIIEAVTKDDKLSYNINEVYYQLYKAEGKYKEALHYKEICSDILDSLTMLQSETKVLEIEKKYNNAKIREENELLKIAQQRNIIIIVIILFLLLLSTAGYIIFRQKSRAKIYRQQAEMDKIKIEFLHLSVELEEKKQSLQNALTNKEEYSNKLKQEIEKISLKYDLLYTQLQKQEQSAKAKIDQQQTEVNNMKQELSHLSIELDEKKQALQHVLTTKEECSYQLQQEIEIISHKYSQLQKQCLETSAVGKKLISLSKKSKLEGSQLISTDKAWRTIMIEVDKIYPRFYSLLKEAFLNLTESERQYCYLHIFGFDANDEAKLLGINPDSVRMKRTRINQKQQKQPEEGISLRNYLIKYLLK